MREMMIHRFMDKSLEVSPILNTIDVFEEEVQEGYEEKMIE